MGPSHHASSWSVNWKSVLPLVLVAVAAVIGWRWVEGGDDATISDDGPAASSVTTAATTTTTTAPATTTSTTSPPTTTTTTVPERRVLISGEMKPCRYGSNCLVASFTIEGFDPHPGRFVCVYPNSRSDFGFKGDGVEDACLSGDQGDTISIEVDGVTSAEISEGNLDGTP